MLPAQRSFSPGSGLSDKPSPFRQAESAVSPLKSALANPQSTVNRVAHMTGKQTFLSVFMAFSDTLVRIYHAILNQFNAKATRQLAQTAPSKSLSSGGILA